VTKVNTSVKVFPAPPLRHLIDDVRQLDAKALRVNSRINASFPYDISALKEAVVAVPSLEQVFDMTSVFSGTREEKGRTLTDAVEFDAHVEESVVMVVVRCGVDGSRIEVVV
jgi:hypothetical protein